MVELARVGDLKELNQIPIPLRVLVVEDCAADCQLLLRHLRLGGYEPAYELVDSPEAMEKALEDLEPDLIISDYVMPRFSGLAALELMKARGLDLPFIIVSGQIGEETAVAAMKAGAHDYIIKGNLARLIPAVERELREAQVRREHREADEKLQIAHDELRRANAELEMRVERRTEALARANAELQVEVAERQRAEEEREDLLRHLQVVNERLAISSLQASQQAREAERQAAELQALLKSMTDSVVVLDASGGVVLRNEASRRLSGVLSEPATIREYSGLSVRQPDGSTIPVESWPANRLLRGEHFAEEEFIVERPDGSSRRAVASGTTIPDEDGGLALAIMVSRDVTELRKLEQTREEYLSLISHDLRNPLTVIQGQASILKQTLAGGGHEGSLQSLDGILTSVQRINAMIQNLVESVRLESGQQDLKTEPVNLHLFISDLLGRQSRPEWKRVRMLVPEDLPAVQADPDSLDRILINLITNSLKYAPGRSSVLLRADAKPGEVIISVADKGVGIAPEELPRVFDRFYRAQGHKQNPGLGLGLYITRLLVEAHGGRIAVESSPGQGSNFRFTLPTA